MRRSSDHPGEQGETFPDVRVGHPVLIFPWLWEDLLNSGKRTESRFRVTTDDNEERKEEKRGLNSKRASSGLGLPDLLQDLQGK